MHHEHDDFYHDEPDGSCESCGLDLDQDPRGDHDEHHRLCWECWRADNEPEGAPQASIADRRWERLLARMSEFERRLERLEGSP